MVAILATLALAAGNVLAQQPDGLEVYRSRATGLAAFVTPTDGGTIPVPIRPGRARVQPIDFLTQYGELFGVTDPVNQLIETRTQTDNLGYTHTTYEQVHDGIPVYSGVLKVHQNAAGGVTAANGDFYPISFKLNTTPRLDGASAVQIALAQLPDAAPEVERLELVIVDPGWYGDLSIGAHLAYYIVLADLAAGIEEAFFVDAHAGWILDQWNLIQTSKVRSIHDHMIPGGSDCCFAKASPGCSDAACAAAVCSYHEDLAFCCSAEWAPVCASYAYYIHPECNGVCPGLPGPLARFESDQPSLIDDVNTAYDYYGDTYDYYSRGHDRDSINDAGMTMVATVNSGMPGCPNAFWWGGNVQQMVFCPGTVTDDIVGHELTHGVTDYTADLAYQNQPGQLNESFSDVFGELIDLFNGDAAFAGPPGGTRWPTEHDRVTGPGTDEPNDLRDASCSGPGDSVRWLMGEDAAVFGGAIRDMWEPTCANPPDPDRAYSPYQTCDAGDAGGIHSGSGIPNHAFAIVTDGKNFNGYDVTGIGPIKSGAVWYRTLAAYLTLASDFEDAYHAFNQAAADLVGTAPDDPRTGQPSDSEFTAFDADQVDKALRAVEMDGPGRCGSGIDPFDLSPPTECSPLSVIRSFDFNTVVGGWTPSNTSPPTPYNWELTGAVPGPAGGGSAWFCEDLNSICTSGAPDESAVHRLTSPSITMPSVLNFPSVRFRQYVDAEAGWDGGNIKIKVNDGAWQLVPADAFTHNPYNAQPLFLDTMGNTNPLQGEPGFSGEIGEDQWVISVFDLGQFVSGGETVQFRFEFGKDWCAGTGPDYNGWYVDDFVIYHCAASTDCNTNGIADDIEIDTGSAADCDVNGLPDDCQMVHTFSASSGEMSPIGDNSPQSYTIPSAPAAGGDVILDLAVRGDFNGESEYLEVDINGTAVGTAFKSGARNCPNQADTAQLGVDAETYNTAVAGGDAVINLVASDSVSPSDCGGNTTVSVTVSYPLAMPVGDCNINDVLDACDVTAGTSVDCDTNGVPDECQPDCNTNGVADECDITGSTSTDCNANGVPDECEPDCNTNGVADECDIDQGTSPDCNVNDVPDECDIAQGASNDCNTNGVPDDCEPDCNGNRLADECDIAQGTSDDCNTNAVPDECEPDCNTNGVADECDITAGTSDDCNTNAVPDECEVDCNTNGVPDDCDLAHGTSADLNTNGIPDECDECLQDGDCDDGLFCNGVEACPAGQCVSGAPVCAGYPFCVEDLDLCADCLSNTHCDNGKFCDGAEQCAAGACQPGDDPCPDGPCDEYTDSCRECWTWPDCDDGLWCTGMEMCVDGKCMAGTRPCSPGDVCDENADACIPPPPPECTVNADCNDGLWCNGSETCVSEVCVAGTSACSAKEICDEFDDICRDCAHNSECDDGLFCNGSEICDELGDCQPGTPPCQQGLVCLENEDHCIECSTNSECDDGLFCNGTERCGTNGLCLSGSPPCLGRLCDEAGDVCVDCLTDADCIDGVFCNGEEHCVNGACRTSEEPCPDQECCEPAEVCGTCPCTSAADCVDGDPCTDDICVGATCANPPIIGCNDNDLDGVRNNLDRCPNTPQGADVDEHGCSCDQLDEDGDGLDNCSDLCPGSPVTKATDADGCACSQLDDDGDGVDNCEDRCPGSFPDVQVGGDGCSWNQGDDDRDGVHNHADLCPDTNSNAPVDADGCSLTQLTDDEDGDGVINPRDHCLGTPAGESVDDMGCSASQLAALDSEIGATLPGEEGTASVDRGTGGGLSGPCGTLGLINVAFALVGSAGLRIASRRLRRRDRG